MRSSPTFGLLGLLLTLTPLSVEAQDVEEAASLGGDAPAEARDDRAQHVVEFGGPGSAASDIHGDAVTDPRYRLPSFEEAAEPYGRFKNDLSERYMLSLSLDYQVSAFAVSGSLGDTGAVSGMVRFFGTWAPVDPGGDFAGSFTFKIESRNAYTDVASQFLGFEAGAQSLLGTQFSDAGFIVTNAFWLQSFWGERVKILLGQIDVTDFFDVYGLINPRTGFSNYAFIYSTVPAPDQGLGAGVAIYPTDWLYVSGSVADANGDPADLGMRSPIETFKYVEVGVVSSHERRYFDNIHVTLWQADARTLAMVPEDWGMRFSAAWFFSNLIMPFARGGFSTGGAALMEWSAEAGVGVLTRQRDLMAIGLNVGRPFIAGADPQFTGEAFYRFQLNANFAATAVLQVIGNPPNNPNEDVLVAGGLRVRLQI